MVNAIEGRKIVVISLEAPKLAEISIMPAQTTAFARLRIVRFFILLSNIGEILAWRCYHRVTDIREGDLFAHESHQVTRRNASKAKKRFITILWGATALERTTGI